MRREGWREREGEEGGVERERVRREGWRMRLVKKPPIVCIHNTR